jgi:hypothetical protein
MTREPNQNDFDKSYGKDNFMRLYEFTDPNRYFSRDPEVADLLKQSEETNDIVHDSVRRQKKKPDTKGMTLLATL